MTEDEQFDEECKEQFKNYYEVLEVVVGELEKHKQIEKNADALIELGLKEWLRTRRKGKAQKKKKDVQDQLRDIEDSMVEDK